MHVRCIESMVRMNFELSKITYDYERNVMFSIIASVGLTCYVWYVIVKVGSRLTVWKSLPLAMPVTYTILGCDICTNGQANIVSLLQLLKQNLKLYEFGLICWRSAESFLLFIFCNSLNLYKSLIYHSTKVWKMNFVIYIYEIMNIYIYIVYFFIWN